MPTIKENLDAAGLVLPFDSWFDYLSSYLLDYLI